jgi:hypothetical protein
MIIYQSRFLTRGEVWFDSSPGPEPVDWVLYYQRPQPDMKGKWRPFYTRIIDLSQPTDLLLAQMDGFTAADIKRATKKDQTRCKKIETADAKALDEFADFYDRFAAIKRVGCADRHWLERTARADKLDIWAADTPESCRLAYHVFYREPRRVRSFLAASFYAEASTKEAQRKIGRANRLLIWECMQYYRAAGVDVFDLGGWYTGTTDTPLLGINKFKEGFGGKVICEYQGEHLRTMKAWGALLVGRVLSSWNERKTRKEGATDGSLTPVWGLQKQQTH